MHKVSELLGSRIKPTNERFGLWLLEENLHSNNLVTDIGNINYSQGEEMLSRVNIKPLTSLTNPFCDNVMLVKITDSTDCVEDRPIVKKEICGAFNSYLRGKFLNLVSARHGVKAKLPFPLLGKRAMAERVRNIIGVDRMVDIGEKFKTPIAIPYKVELADVELTTLQEHMLQILEDLQTHDFYLMDLDITQDFVGVFNKQEMCEHLVRNYNFRYQGDQYIRSYNTIVNNDKSVGIDCLVWITPSGARVKIYNKFICQLTSPGVNSQIGSHIVDFVNCPDTRLRQTFLSPMAKDHGITRLEATIYNGKGELPLENCITVLDNNKNYFQEAPFYSVAIPKMWTKLTDSLQNSCCVVCNDILQYAYWGNSNTRKITGVQITIPNDQNQRTKIINYVLSAFSFNYLPVNYLEIVEDVAIKENINIVQKCYIKSGETFFSKTSTAFSTICKTINLEKCGLVPTKNVIPQILRKRTNVSNRPQPYSLKEIEPSSTVYLTCAKKRKLELEEIEIKKRKLEYLEQAVSLKKDYPDLLEKEKIIRESRERMTSYFNKPWKNLDLQADYKVSAFTVDAKEKYAFVGILAEKDGDIHVYFLKGKHKPWLIEVYNDRKQLTKDGFVLTPNKDLDIVHLATEKTIFTFKTNGITSFNNHSFAKIECLELLTDAWKNPEEFPYKQEEVEDILSTVAMQEIKGKIIPRQCRRLEELEEGVELVVCGIKEINYRKNIRYILQFENLDVLYISNYWLEKEIKDLNVNLNCKFRVKLDKIKTTVNKHKERVIFCTYN